jgi:hypothetical protein
VQCTCYFSLRHRSGSKAEFLIDRTSASAGRRGRSPTTSTQAEAIPNAGSDAACFIGRISLRYVCLGADHQRFLDRTNAQTQRLRPIRLL